MIRFTILLFPFVVLLWADQPVWDKPLAEWSAADAQDFLTGSPWVKVIKPEVMRKLSESERREGGNMAAEGGSRGVGWEGLDNLSLFGGKSKGSIPRAAGQPKLWIRWESAITVRAAELRSADKAAPTIDGEDYALCVYDVPLNMFTALNMRTLPEDLKRVGWLKPDGAKAVQADRVLVRPDGSGIATLVYFFPRSANISADIKRIEFVAQVGRLYLSQFFYPEEMKFQNKLAL